MAWMKSSLVLVIPVFCVSACSLNAGMAPIETRNTEPDHAQIQPEKIAPIYMVKPGDTLYSIAWQAKRDFRQLAQWNEIESPYLIKYGQRIKLSPSALSAASSQPIVEPQQPLAMVPNSDDFSVEILPDSQTQTNKPISQRQPAADKKPKETTKPAIQKPTFGKVRHWLWPADGKRKRIVSRKRGMDGVAIYGKSGQPIKAAAPGEVVYQGSGILGLGKLVIIKHNETYLSAYAHNQRILVKEGEIIKRGQMIAKMGKSDADRVNLYFEIRKNGKPVNPLKVLR